MQGVILDVDGTLVDSNDAHAESWVDAFRERGYVIPFDRIRPLIGMGGDRLIFSLASIEEDSAEGQEILEARKEIFLRDYLHLVKPFPGVRELLTEMHDRGLKLAVASSSEEEILSKLLALTGAAHLLEHRVDASQVRETKPAPDLVLAALDLLGIASRQAAMLGDTPYDRDSARAAGVAFVGLRCGGWRDADLDGAIAVYGDPAGLLRRFDFSPFASAPVRLERRSAS